ncbi:MAG: citramalate synthase [Candidatus Gastranaerophilales bacterium]|nr:citramalate synthase [Candidatus Gastranaerophilales bacterium]
MSEQNKIEIYDTTLRDGAQAEGIAYTVSDKLKIVRLLDDLGIDYIELGWPGSNPKDDEIFQLIKNVELKNSTITAFGCTKKPLIPVEEDKVLEQLVLADTSVVTIFGKTWDFHVEHALNTTLEENLNMIKDSITYLISKGKKVFFDAEHFFDGYKNNKEYSLETIKTAFEAGASRIVLCDTNGGTLNNQIYNVVKEVKEFLPDAVVGVHVHNDGDLAIANSIAAVQSGATQIHGTINGYGERCGNANLCSVIPNLQIKLNYDVIGDNIEKLCSVSRQVAEIANRKASDYAPFVGRSAFAHKAGIHASGVIKSPETYEHLSPEKIGNTRRILVSDQAGTTTIKKKLENLKLNIDVKEDDIPVIIDKIKQLEWQGFTFENADASFEITILKALNQMPDYFSILGFRVIDDTIAPAEMNLNSEASVKIKISNDIIHTVSEGDGPVNALDMALRKALKEIYPVINNFKLDDFKVRILDGKEGTGARTRVHVETTDGFNRWDTVGVSSNITEAAYTALVDSILFGLLLNNAKPLNE